MKYLWIVMLVIFELIGWGVSIIDCIATYKGNIKCENEGIAHVYCIEDFTIIWHFYILEVNMAAKLTYDIEYYRLDKILGKLKGEIGDAATNRKEIRAEYTRLRDIAQKRLKRMGETKFRETNTYKFNVKHYPKLKDIKTVNELAGRLADLARFIVDPYGTLTKQKEIMKKSLITLHENDYTFVTEENYIEFGKFMEYYRDTHYDEIYDSGDAADAYGVTVKHQIDPEKVKEDFEFWLENIQAAKDLKRSKQSIGNYDKMKTRVSKKVKSNGNNSK